MPTQDRKVAFHVRKSLEVAITALCLISPIINRSSTQPYMTCKRYPSPVLSSHNTSIHAIIIIKRCWGDARLKYNHTCLPAFWLVKWIGIFSPVWSVISLFALLLQWVSCALIMLKVFDESLWCDWHTLTRFKKEKKLNLQHKQIPIHRESAVDVVLRVMRSRKDCVSSLDRACQRTCVHKLKENDQDYTK